MNLVYLPNFDEAPNEIQYSVNKKRPPVHETFGANTEDCICPMNLSVQIRQHSR